MRASTCSAAGDGVVVSIATPAGDSAGVVSTFADGAAVD
jgi:hypothetical protein